MNPVTSLKAAALLKEILILQKKFHTATISLAVPSVFSSDLVKQAKGKLSVGLQNIHSELDGAHTGDISAPQGRSVGISFTVLGHSERRALGETNEVINKKVLAALAQKLSVVLCVGEVVRDTEGNYLEAISTQVKLALGGVDQKHLKNISIAYEPVWAIGAAATGVATPVECHEVAILIRRTISDMYSQTISKKITILYGGSANSDNASGFINDGGVQGFLLGRASLDAEEMKKILVEVTK